MKKEVSQTMNFILMAIIYILILIQYPVGVAITQLILHKNVQSVMQPGFLLLWGLVRIAIILPLIFLLMQRLSWDASDIFMRLGDYKRVIAITFWFTFGFMLLGLGLYPWFLHVSKLSPLLFLEYIPIFLIYAISNAFVEETFFRGVAQNFFARKLSIYWAILIQAVFFAAIHIDSPMTNNLWLFISLTLGLGLLWGYLTNHYKSLVPAIVIHIIADVFVAVSLF